MSPFVVLVSFFLLLASLPSVQTQNSGASLKSKAAFQDEVVGKRRGDLSSNSDSRAPGGGAAAADPAMSQRKEANAAFQDSVWQAGRKMGGNDAPAKSLYEEPFTVSEEAEIIRVIDMAYNRVLARLKEKDKTHDGILKMYNVAE